MAVGRCHLNARSIAAVSDHVRPRSRDGAACSPEFDYHCGRANKCKMGKRPKHEMKIKCRCQLW
jgi:hypothetical protein